MRAKIINQVRKKIVDFLQNHQEIVAIYLYGSWGENRATKLSDLDLGILLANKFSFHKMWQLEDKLALYLGEFLALEVEVRAMNSLPLSAQFQIITRGRSLAFNDLSKVADYESYVRRRYWDFQRIKKEYHRLFLERKKEALNEAELREYQRTLGKIRVIHRRVKEKARFKTGRI